MERKTIFFYAFIILLLTRWLYSDALSLIYTIVIFLVPLIVLIRRKDYHLFALNVEDTIPSIVVNVGYALVFAFILFMIGWAGNDFSFVMFYGLELIVFLRVLFISFLQELLFRYFLQGELIKLYGKWIGIIVTSVISAVIIFPPLSMSLTFLFMGLIIGWVFHKTNDVYGATLAHFLIQTVSLIML